MATNLQLIQPNQALSHKALDHMAKSDLTTDDAKTLHRQSIPSVFGEVDGYRIPYFEPDGKVNGFWRDRLFGVKDKYKQPLETAPRLYLPPLLDRPWSEIAADTSVEIVMTEGENKSACACKAGIPTIGLGGVWSWMAGGKPIADLDAIAWQGRSVTIAFDSDAARNPHVQLACIKLATELCGRGAKVRIADLQDDGGAKVGLDDYLVAHGADALRTVLDAALPFDDVIGELNRKHFAVVVGGKFYVAIEHRDAKTGHDDFDLMDVASFQHLYANRTVNVPATKGTKKVNAGTVWLQSKWRREYSRIDFMPKHDVPDVYNLWRGFAVEPREGDCSLFLAHIHDNICRRDKPFNEWVVAWMADAVQHPAQIHGTALAMRGPEGAGKGVFAKGFGSLFGVHFTHVSNTAHLLGKFNAHTKNALILFGDEAVWAGDKASEGTLKALISEETRLIESKGVNALSVPNYVHLIMATNNAWAVPAGLDARRFCVMDVGDERLRDYKYFAAIEKQMDSGGREALLHYLLHLDISHMNLREAPKTAALMEAKVRSLDPLQNFIFELLRDADAKTLANGIACDELQARYVESAKNAGVNHRSTATILGITLKNLIPGIAVKKRYDGAVKRQVRRYMFPPLKECRAAFDKKIQQAMNWNDIDPGAVAGGGDITASQPRSPRRK